MEEVRELNVTPNHIDNPESKGYPIDYCIVIMDGMQPFIELHFESLMRTETFDSFASVHLVDKQTTDGTIEYCRKMCPKIEVHSLDSFIPKNRLGEPILSGWQWDMAYSYEFAVKNCGTAPWICMMHPDVVFWNAKEYFEGIYKMMYPEVGIIWEGCMSSHRREAHWQTSIKFWPLFGANYTHDENGQNGLLLHENDSRNKGRKVFPIRGIEMWELLSIEIQTLGWVCAVIPYELYALKDHMSQCSKHDFDPNNPENVKRFEDKMERVYNRLFRLRADESNYM